jgi:hypothetical protein
MPTPPTKKLTKNGTLTSILSLLEGEEATKEIPDHAAAF